MSSVGNKLKNINRRENTAFAMNINDLKESYTIPDKSIVNDLLYCALVDCVPFTANLLSATDVKTRSQYKKTGLMGEDSVLYIPNPSMTLANIWN